MPTLTLTVKVSAESWDKAYKKLDRAVEILSEDADFENEDYPDTIDKNTWHATVEVTEDPETPEPATPSTPYVYVDEQNDGLGNGFLPDGEASRRSPTYVYP